MEKQQISQDQCSSAMNQTHWMLSKHVGYFLSAPWELLAKVTSANIILMLLAVIVKSFVSDLELCVFW